MSIHSDGFLSFVFDFCTSFIEKVVAPKEGEHEFLLNFSKDYEMNFTLDDFLSGSLVLLTVLHAQI
jgi:hypothetical protein